MKKTKKFLIGLLLGITAIFSTLVFSACKEENKGQAGLTFETLEMDKDTASFVVENEQQEFDFTKEIIVNEGTYVVSLDSYGLQTVITKIVPLSAGDNTFYIIYSLDKSITVYTVNIRRRPMYTVAFNENGGSVVQDQTVEESYFATAPTQTTTRAGYDFAGWDYDFSQAITGNITINAQWTAHTDTAYKVEYYFQDLQGQYVLDNTKTENKTGKTDTTASVTAETITGFTYDEWQSKPSGNINGDGSLVLKLYYSRSYTVTVNSNNTSAGTVSGGRTYKYGQEVTVMATTNLGYTFLGWYNGETLISDKSSYILTMPAENLVYTAKWEVAEEMQNFEFSSTETTCSITEIKDNTITEVVIPDYITSIGSDAFYNCRSLKSVVIGDGVTSIGSSAFYGCNSLASIEIPDSVTSIGLNAFGACSSLTSVVIGDSVTSIGYYAFYYCDILASVVIGDSVTSIGNSAFYGCDSLTSIEIPDSVKSIGEYAFEYCNRLTIYCEAESKPSGWDKEWNSSNRPVVWGYTGE